MFTSGARNLLLLLQALPENGSYLEFASNITSDRTVWALWLHEPALAAGTEAADWLLLTNVAVMTWAETTEHRLVRCVVGHQVAVQDPEVGGARLEAAEKLIPYLTLMGMIA